MVTPPWQTENRFPFKSEREGACSRLQAGRGNESIKHRERGGETHPNGIEPIWVIRQTSLNQTS